MSMTIKRALLYAARTPYGGTLAYLGLVKFRKLFPGNVIGENKNALLLRHPAAADTGHLLLLPKRRIRDLPSLVSDPVTYNAMAALLWEHFDRSQQYICCNLGSRQEVNQVHIHVLKRHDGLKKSLPDQPFLLTNKQCYIRYEDFENTVLLKQALMEGMRACPDALSVLWI